jgi:hypothetical protein
MLILFILFYAPDKLKGTPTPTTTPTPPTKVTSYVAFFDATQKIYENLQNAIQLERVMF